MKISLDGYFQELHISQRARNLCISKRLKTIDDLLKHYEKKGTFLNFRKCGIKTNNELVKICENLRANPNVKYSNLLEPAVNTTKIKRTDISIRAYNLCVRNHLNTIESLIDFYNIKQSFRDLTRTHIQIDSELIEFCQKSLKKSEFSHLLMNNGIAPTIPFLNFTTMIDRLTKDSSEELDHKLTVFLRCKLILMGGRTKNLLLDILDSGNDSLIIKLAEIKKLVFTEAADYKYVGESTVKAIELVLTELVDYYNYLRSETHSPTDGIESFKQLVVHFDQRLSEFINNNMDLMIPGKINLFEFINRFILKVLLRPDESFIFSGKFNCYLDSVDRTDTYLSVVLKLTRERVRQKSLELIEIIKHHLVFYSLHIQEILSLTDYRVNTEDGIICIDEKLRDKLNKSGNTNFSVRYFALLLSGIFEQLYYFEGENEGLKNFFLINKNLYHYFDFKAMMADLLKRTRRVEKTYSISYNVYFKKFVIKNDEKYNKLIRKVFETFASCEFGLVFNASKITIPKNTRKLMNEYIIEILEENGKFMHVTEIQKHLVDRYPDKRWILNSIRSTSYNTKEIVYFGKTSTYGLKKWNALNGNSYCNIVEEILLKEDKPVHASYILKMLDMNKPSSEDTLKTNLIMDQTNRFIVFYGGFIGLRNKPYKKEFVNFKRLQLHEYIKIKKSIYSDLLPMNYWEVIEWLKDEYGLIQDQARILLDKAIEKKNLSIIGDIVQKPVAN